MWRDIRRSVLCAVSWARCVSTSAAAVGRGGCGSWRGGDEQQQQQQQQQGGRGRQAQIRRAPACLHISIVTSFICCRVAAGWAQEGCVGLLKAFAYAGLFTIDCPSPVVVLGRAGRTAPSPRHPSIPPSQRQHTVLVRPTSPPTTCPRRSAQHIIATTIENVSRARSPISNPSPAILLRLSFAGPSSTDAAFTAQSQQSPTVAEGSVTLTHSLTHSHSRQPTPLRSVVLSPAFVLAALSC